MSYAYHCALHAPMGMTTERNYLPFKGNRNDTCIHKLSPPKFCLRFTFRVTMLTPLTVSSAKHKDMRDSNCLPIHLD